MTNNTVTTETTAVSDENKTVLPPEKLINWLISEASKTEGTEEDRMRELIKSVWNQATVEKRKSVPYYELLTNHNMALAPLNERIQETLFHFKNTVRKMYQSAPYELTKVLMYKSDNARLVDIIQPKKESGWGARPNLLNKFTPGSSLSTHNLVARIYISDHMPLLEIPVDLLHNDPVAIAQHVRKLCAANKRTTQAETRAALEEQRVQTVKDAESAKAKLVDLEDSLIKADVQEENLRNKLKHIAQRKAAAKAKKLELAV